MKYAKPIHITSPDAKQKNIRLCLKDGNKWHLVAGLFYIRQHTNTPYKYDKENDLWEIVDNLNVPVKFVGQSVYCVEEGYHPEPMHTPNLIKPNRQLDI